MAKWKVNKQLVKTPMPELDPQVRACTFDEVSLGYNAEEAVNEARRCLQCKSAPCVEGCPVGVPIPQFVACVAEEDFMGAYALVKGANSLPAICGRVCPQESQCEGRCARGRKGEPVGIGRLERFVAEVSMADRPSEQLDAAASPSTHSRGDTEGSRTEVRFASAIPTIAGTGETLADFGGPAASDEPAGVGEPAGADELAGRGAAAGSLSGRRVAVVGSGPAALTCAGELAKRGCAVTVFEALHKVGGVLTYGIPEFRLPKDLVAREVAAIADLGVEFRLNSVIGKLFDVRELLDEQGFDAVFVGTGAGLPSYLGIEGEGLNGVSVANELLTRVNLMKAYRYPEYDTPVYAGKRCVVVGGGNVAMDAARTAKRLGADVTVVYRRGRDEMPARAEEVHHAEEEGIHFQLLTNPVRIIGDDKGWVTGVECVKMELGEPDAGGRRRPVAVEGSNFVMDIDMFITAAGSKTNPLVAQTTPGLEVTSRNLIVADERTGATSIPGVFAGGDVVIGAATVILAMGAGKRAAAGIAEYLAG